jgi:hypothetical protein
MEEPLTQPLLQVPPFYNYYSELISIHHQDFSLTHLVELETGAAAVLFRDLCNEVLTTESSCGN